MQLAMPALSRVASWLGLTALAAGNLPAALGLDARAHLSRRLVQTDAATGANCCACCHICVNSVLAHAATENSVKLRHSCSCHRRGVPPLGPARPS